MTSETPCVAGCINAEFHDEYHRQSAEPAVCVCGNPEDKVVFHRTDGPCHNYQTGLSAKPAEPPACRWKPEITGSTYYWISGEGRSRCIIPDSGKCPYCSGEIQTAEPQSEPPIDHRFEAMHAAWKAEQAISIALRAERDALRATLLERCQTIDRLVKERDYERDQNQVLCQRAEAFDAHMTRENAALKVRVDDLENLVLDIDDGQEAATVYARAIRARRQEASNDK